MFTCCSISNALLSPSFSSLSGDGKLRKEETSGGRGADTGVDNYDSKEETKESQLTSTILFFMYFLALIGSQHQKHILTKLAGAAYRSHFSHSQ